MKKLIIVSLITAALPLAASANDLSGRFGVGGVAGAAIPVGSSNLVNKDDIGPAGGAWIAYGLTSRWTARASYDNLYLRDGRSRIQPVEFGAGYSLCPKSAWNPTIAGGLGPWTQRNVTTSNSVHVLGFGLGIGVSHFITQNVSVGARLDWFASIRQGSETTDAHVLRPGVTLGWWFGAPKEQEAAAPVSTPANVSVSVNPQDVNLAAGAAQSFSANVAGSDNAAVVWSIAPQVGSVSQSGVYTAPNPIAISQTVAVTATSVADGSKAASAQVHLIAPKSVAIALNVRFDTGKAVVKPKYDSQLAKVADFMKTYSATSAEIQGYTDNVGNAGYNRNLSQRRADAVRQALIDRFGVSASRLTAKGYGQDNPIAGNGTAAGRAKNRRVVAEITAQQ